MIEEDEMVGEHEMIMEEIKEKRVKHKPDKTIKWEEGMYGH